MIVVTGMHRSGTSSIAMIMESLGVDFGDHEAFYEADRWNERGYFEREDVIDLNSRIVTGFPRTQGRISALLSQFRYMTLPSQKSIENRAQGLNNHVQEVAEHLSGLAVKDPRFCLTLSAWRPFTSSVVVCLRHPAAVAKSLHRRQRMPLRLAYKVWDYHIAALLEESPDHALHVDFDALSRPGEASREISLIRAFFDLDLSRQEAMRRFEARFEPSLRHFDAGADSALPDSTRELWRKLRSRRTT